MWRERGTERGREREVEGFIIIRKWRFIYRKYIMYIGKAISYQEDSPRACTPCVNFSKKAEKSYLRLIAY